VDTGSSYPIADLGSPPGLDDPSLTTTGGRRNRRAVTDEIMIAFHYACDLKDFDVAKRLLITFETALNAQAQSPGPRRQRLLDILVAAHERLWTLKHSEPFSELPLALRQLRTPLR